MVKPNMFQLAPGFYSHPAIVAAVAERAAATGARVVVAERTRALHTVLADSTVDRYAEVRSLDDLPLRLVQIDGAASLRVPLAVPEIVLDCDYFVGVPQVRTHASVIFSNAMKNLVGLLPGFTTRLVHLTGVAESTVDLNLLRPQHLVVCDATVVIEGNYPMAGEPRQVGVLATGTNAVALDAVMASLCGIAPEEVGYLVDAASRGLGPIDVTEVELRGTPLPELAFDIKRAPERIVAPRPGIHVYADTACQACQRYIAGALRALAVELAQWPGELTVLAGPMTAVPPLRGTVVLVGNSQYERRDLGVYLEGCPPRAIQLAGFRHAMGQPVPPELASQFRTPASRWVTHV